MSIPGSVNPLFLGAAGQATGDSINPRDFMDVALWTGNGSTQTISGLGFSPDLVWVKNRSSGVQPHGLFDQVRGVDLWLSSNLTDAETNYGGGFGITAFTATGFTIGNGSAINENGSGIVAWAWDAGSSTVTNTQGSISSQVRANASAGFSVVTYTAGTNAVQTVGHGLGVAPQMIIIKERNQVNNWFVYHASIGNQNYLSLNATSASTASTFLWNSTSPSSTVYTVRSGGSAPTFDGRDHVAYCFAPVDGYSSFGSYTGNGSATGPVISGLGFQPFFIMIKASSTTGDWWMYDGARSPSNPRINKLKANSSAAEDTAGEDVDFQSGGFQIKTSDSGLNQNAATYVYVAFA